MPRYFFHIHDAGDLLRDEEGTQLPNDDAARREAVLTARDIVAENVRSGDVLDGRRFEVVDDTGRSAFTLMFSDVVTVHHDDAPSG